MARIFDIKQVFARLAALEIDECVVWPRSVIRDGYGRIRQGHKTVQTHRLAYEKRFGPIPAGLCVLHHCDNRPCMNYRHLFIGTPYDNNKDKRQKNRHAHGESHPLAKANEALVSEIRSRYVFGSKTSGTPALARIYGLAQTTIHHIVSRKHWRDVK